MTENASEAVPVILRASAGCRPQSIRREFLCRCLASTVAQAEALLWLAWLHLLSDCPNEAGKFARDCGDGHRQLLAAAGQRPIAGAKASLRFQGDVAHGRRDTLMDVVLQLSGS